MLDERQNMGGVFPHLRRGGGRDFDYHDADTYTVQFLSLNGSLMSQQDQKSIAWPLMFTYRGTILGRGFLADIDLHGRLLATPEVEGVWLYGVNPGAVAVGSPTLGAANTELRNTLTRLFIDFAEQAPSFDAFKHAVEGYFCESDAASESEWETARQEVRAGRIPVPDGLPKQEGDYPCFVHVTQKQIETVTPQDNLLIQQEAKPVLAAAA